MIVIVVKHPQPVINWFHIKLWGDMIVISEQIWSSHKKCNVYLSMKQLVHVRKGVHEEKDYGEDKFYIN